MKNNAVVTGILQLLIILSSVALIVDGIHMICKWDVVPTVEQNPITTDSSYSHTQNRDSSGKIQKIVTETTINRNTHATPAQPAIDSTLRDNVLKRAYDLILLGLFVLLLFLILPCLSEFSLLSLFTAKFRDQVDAGKKVINEAASVSNNNPPPTPEVKMVPLSDALPNNKIVRYATDPQKGEWGGKPADAGRKVAAFVEHLPGNEDLFRVRLKVISTDANRPLTGKVNFHLHPTFINPSPSVYVIGGEATLEFISRGSFTIGVETDQGTTHLELDLSEIPNAQLLFKGR